LSKNKGTRTRNPQLFIMKFHRSMHAALCTISVYLQIKKIEEESSCEIQVSNEIKALSF